MFEDRHLEALRIVSRSYGRMAFLKQTRNILLLRAVWDPSECGQEERRGASLVPQ